MRTRTRLAAACLVALASAGGACAQRASPKAAPPPSRAATQPPAGSPDEPRPADVAPSSPETVPATAAADVVVVGTADTLSDVPAGVPVVRVELAATGAARERGLMGRKSLADGCGMLFVYAQPGVHRFWMKDCEIGLDIVWIDADGRIVDIATLPPGLGLPDADVPDHESAVPVAHILEVRAGWMREHGLGVGARCDLARALEGVRPR